RVHLRHFAGPGSGAYWRDACSVAGAALAVLMAAMAGPSLVYHATALPVRGFDVLLVLVPLASVLTGVGVALGRRRLSLGAAWAAVVGTAAGMAWPVDIGPGFSALASPYLVGIALSAAVFLSVPNEPRRGVSLIWRRRRSAWGLAVGAGLFLAVYPWTSGSVNSGYWLLSAVLPTLSAYAAGIAVWSPVGRRATLLLAAPVIALIEILWLPPAITWGSLAPVDLLAVALPLATFALVARHFRPTRPDGDELTQPTQPA
ncbi:MAG TPA: hypothetical protein VHJ17_06350, partial [Thermomonospora sp.]|nr:hypothetical protein [Thermomonospora sp.]